MFILCYSRWFCVAGFAVVARRSVLKAAGYADVPRPSKAAPKKTAPPKKTPAKISATSNQTTDSPKGTKEKRRGLTPPDKQAKKAKEDGNEQKVIIYRTFFNIVQSTYKICICIFLPGVAEDKEEPEEKVRRQQEMRFLEG